MEYHEGNKQECTSNCNTCGKDCSSDVCGEAGIKESLNPNSSVKKVIGVISGKGGVGKSMVTALAATLANRNGLKTGILDADITGPSIPRMFGMHTKAQGSAFGIIPVETPSEVKLMSINLLTENESDPVVWRGPVIAGAVKQFWTDVVWGELDVMFIDMPPGTGDVPLTVFQSIPIDGIIVVTSPQELVAMIVEKAVKMAKMMNIPILGIIENMSYIECPGCGRRIEPFGASSIEKVASDNGIKVLATLPLDPELAKLSDSGHIEWADVSAMDPLLAAIE